MTSAIAELVQTIESRGVKLREKAGAVVARPAGMVTPTEREVLAQAKEEVLSYLRSRPFGVAWARVSLSQLDKVLEVAVPWSDVRLLIAPGCKVAKELRAHDPQPGRIWCTCEILDLILTNTPPEDTRNIAEARLTFYATLGGVRKAVVRCAHVVDPARKEAS